MDQRNGNCIHTGKEKQHFNLTKSAEGIGLIINELSSRGTADPRANKNNKI